MFIRRNLYKPKVEMIKQLVYNHGFVFLNLKAKLTIRRLVKFQKISLILLILVLFIPLVCYFSDKNKEISSESVEEISNVEKTEPEVNKDPKLTLMVDLKIRPKIDKMGDIPLDIRSDVTTYLFGNKFWLPPNPKYALGGLVLAMRLLEKLLWQKGFGKIPWTNTLTGKSYIVISIIQMCYILINNILDQSKWHVYMANFYKPHLEFNDTIWKNMELPQRVGAMPGMDGKHLKLMFPKGVRKNLIFLCSGIYIKQELAKFNFPFTPRVFQMPVGKEDFQKYSKEHPDKIFASKSPSHRNINLMSNKDPTTVPSGYLIQVVVPDLMYPYLLF